MAIWLIITLSVLGYIFFGFITCFSYIKYSDDYIEDIDDGFAIATGILWWLFWVIALIILPYVLAKELKKHMEYK